MGVFTAGPPTAHRPRTGRLLPGPGQRPARDHRASTRPRSARRSAAPASTRTRRGRTPCTTCSNCRRGDGVQERDGRARPRRRQGRHLGRPGRDQVRGAAARVRPVRRSRSTAATTPPATSAPTCQDMDVIARETRFVTGRSVEHGGCGDSSVLTAYGRVPGHAGRRRAPLGQPDAAPAGGSASPASARSAST